MDIKAAKIRRIYSNNCIIRDCPIEEFLSLHGAVAYREHAIIQPEGWITASVRIPEELRNEFLVHAHTRSTFARIGIQVVLDQTEVNRLLVSDPLPEKIRVTIENWGEYPVLFRKGDTIVLTNIFLTDTLPPVPITSEPESIMENNVFHLHAGDKYLTVSRWRVPRLYIAERRVRVIDPHMPHLDHIMKTRRFETLDMHPDEFFVIEAHETIRIPKNEVAILHRAHDAIHHTSAVLVYPDWTGKLILEFKAIQKITLYPGMLIAFLSVYRPTNPLPDYSGKYQNQKDIRPQG